MQITTVKIMNNKNIATSCKLITAVCFSYLLVSTLILSYVFFFLPSASRDPVKPFFCFLQISLYLRFDAEYIYGFI